MYRTLKRLLMLLPLFLLLLSSTCMAEEYSIREIELTTLEQNSAMLREKIQKLESISIQSQAELERAQQKLAEYQTELEKYQSDLARLQIRFLALETESTAAKVNLEASNKSLTKTKEYIEKYEREVQLKIRKLEAQRALLIIGLGASLFVNR